MKKTLFAMASLLAFSAMSAFGAQWTGVISDSMCNVKHLDSSDKSIACVKSCVKGGDNAVFITGADNKIYKIDKASMDKVQPHLGHKVTITGTLNGDTVTIDTITM